MAVRKTTLTINDEVVEQAREILGTAGIKDTIDAALNEVIREELSRRHAERLKELFRDVDFDEFRKEAWRQ
jgi:Arc/MetJ family transcription regulator